MTITTRQIRKILMHKSMDGRSIPALVITDDRTHPGTTGGDYICEVVARGQIELDAKEKPSFQYTINRDGYIEPRLGDVGRGYQLKKLCIDWDEAEMVRLHGYIIIYTPQKTSNLKNIKRVG